MKKVFLLALIAMATLTSCKNNSATTEGTTTTDSTLVQTDSVKVQNDSTTVKVDTVK
jgi:hypothetical protein